MSKTKAAVNPASKTSKDRKKQKEAPDQKALKPKLVLPPESDEDSEDDGIDEESMSKLMDALGEDGLDEFGQMQLESLAADDEEEGEEDEDSEGDDAGSGSESEVEGVDEEDQNVDMEGGVGSDGDADEDEEEDEDEDEGKQVRFEDAEDVDEDAVPRQKIEIDNKVALQRIREEIKLDESLPWTETLTVTYPEGIEVDVEDDINRELAFYKQALHCAEAARKLANQHKLPFTRPSDYFAEMVKTDAHMERIRQKLLDENAQIKRGEEKRKQREGKKYGKQVQVEKLKERERSKKDMEERLRGILQNGKTCWTVLKPTTVISTSRSRMPSKEDRPPSAQSLAERHGILSSDSGGKTGGPNRTPVRAPNNLIASERERERKATGRERAKEWLPGESREKNINTIPHFVCAVNMVSFFDVPIDIVEQVLLNSVPVDVAKLSQTCRRFYSCVYSAGSTHIWKALFLHVFDDPHECRLASGLPYDTEGFSWRKSLQDRTEAQFVVCGTSSSRRSLEKRIKALQTLLSTITTIPPATTTYTTQEISKNLIWAAGLLKTGSTFLDDDIWASSSDTEVQQLLAQMHTHYGLTLMDLTLSSQAVSRAYVYDMRRYNPRTNHGPYLSNEREGMTLNWVHIRAIQHIMSVHTIRFGQQDEIDHRLSPMSLPFCQSIIPVGTREREPMTDELNDWAGVSGNWKCAFCYCDHLDLIAYNRILENEHTNPGFRPSRFFESPDFAEVHRVIRVKFVATKTEHDDLHPLRPRISFKGFVGETQTMAGYVSMTPDDHIRWQFVSGENDNSIWSSEGVQIGSAQSAYGVLGVWTTVFHDESDPVGPFWLSKLFLEDSS